MASINLSGVLRNPDTTLAKGGEIRLIHRSNTGEVVAGFRETLNVNNDGTYDFDIQYGNVFIQTRDVGVNQWTDHGTLTINQDTSATTLPELLNAAVPPTDAQLLEFQILLSDAEAAADRAEAAGERSIKVYPTLADIQADSELEAGKVVTNFQAKLDYYISETQETGGVAISGTSPQLYANPQQTTPGTGETNTASNIGDGEGLFAQKVSSDLQFYSQVSKYGLESHLVGDTYYRGLNPFIADNIGAFVGDMTTSRSTPTTVINRSGVIEDVPVDTPSYGKWGLSCYKSYTCDLSHSGNITTGTGWGAARCSFYLDPLYDVGKITASRVIPSTDNAIHSGPSKIHTAAIGVNTLTYLIHPAGLGTVLFGSSGTWSPTSGFQLCSVDFRDGTILSGADNVTRLEKLTGGWWLFTHKFVVDTPASSRPTIQILSNDSEQVWAGNGTDAIYFGLVQNSSNIINPPTAFTGSTAETTTATSTTLPVNGNLPVQGGAFCFIVDLNMFYADGFGPAVITTNAGILLSKSNVGKNYASIKTTEGVFYAGLSNDVDDEVVRFAVKYEGGNLKLFKNGTLIESTITTGTPIYSDSDLIFLGIDEASYASINTEMKIKKWFVNEVPTDAQILELGGADNVIL